MKDKQSWKNFLRNHFMVDDNDNLMLEIYRNGMATGFRHGNISLNEIINPNRDIYDIVCKVLIGCLENAGGSSSITSAQSNNYDNFLFLKAAIEGCADEEELKKWQS